MNESNIIGFLSCLHCEIKRIQILGMISVLYVELFYFLEQTNATAPGDGSTKRGLISAVVIQNVLEQKPSFGALFSTILPGYTFPGNFEQYDQYFTIDWSTVANALDADKTADGIKVERFWNAILNHSQYNGPAAKKEDAFKELNENVIKFTRAYYTKSTSTGTDT